MTTMQPLPREQKMLKGHLPRVMHHFCRQGRRWCWRQRRSRQGTTGSSSSRSFSSSFFFFLFFFFFFLLFLLLVFVAVLLVLVLFLLLLLRHFFLLLLVDGWFLFIEVRSQPSFVDPLPVFVRRSTPSLRSYFAFRWCRAEAVG